MRIKNASLKNPGVGAALPRRAWNLDWSVFETRLHQFWRVLAASSGGQKLLDPCLSIGVSVRQ